MIGFQHNLYEIINLSTQMLLWALFLVPNMSR